jgi:hypothetical protein
MDWNTKMEKWVRDMPKEKRIWAFSMIYYEMIDLGYREDEIKIWLYDIGASEEELKIVIPIEEDFEITVDLSEMNK